VGDAIYQPGPYDGGTEVDKIGVLTWWVKINEVGRNYVDAAIGVPLNDAWVDEEILGIGKVSEIANIQVGQLVKKSGRTTGVTQAKVLDVNASVKVNYGLFSAWFDDTIVTEFMAKGGDSGSLLVDEFGRAVGLLFAGSDRLTVHNKMVNVARLLRLDMRKNVMIASMPWFPIFTVLFIAWLQTIYTRLKEFFERVFT